MSRIVESLVMDMTCELVEDMLSASSDARSGGGESLDQVARPLPEQVQQWGPWKHAKEEGDPHMMLGCWPSEDEMGQMPRVSYW